MAAIAAGHVRVEDQRIRPSRALAIGERVLLRKSDLVWNIVVTALTDRRGDAGDAAGLYREAPASVAARAEAVASRKAAAAAPNSSGRPSKRERRKLKEFFERD